MPQREKRSHSLPKGWTVIEKVRKTGKTKGRRDIYVLSPSGKKFRSNRELQSYSSRHKKLKIPEDLFAKKNVVEDKGSLGITDMVQECSNDTNNIDTQPGEYSDDEEDRKSNIYVQLFTPLSSSCMCSRSSSRNSQSGFGFQERDQGIDVACQTKDEYGGGPLKITKEVGIQTDKDILRFSIECGHVIIREEVAV